MPDKFFGNILFVDLSQGTIEEESLDSSIYRDYLSGYGLGVRMLSSAVHQGRMAADAVQRPVHGKRPRHVLNPEMLDSFHWEGPRELFTPEALAELVGDRRPL